MESSKVMLTAHANDISTFTGWSGACVACNDKGNCNLTMTAEQTVTATFTLAPKAMITTTGYPSLNRAYTGATVGGSTTILALDTELTENLYLNSGKSIVLKGGYRADYSGKSGLPTVLKGVLTIGKGSLTVEGLVVR